MSQWFNQFYASIAQSPLSHWLETLPAQLKHWQLEASHGDLPKWQKVLKTCLRFQHAMLIFLLR